MDVPDLHWVELISEIISGSHTWIKGQQPLVLRQDIKFNMVVLGCSLVSPKTSLSWRTTWMRTSQDVMMSSARYIWLKILRAKVKQVIIWGLQLTEWKNKSGKSNWILCAKINKFASQSLHEHIWWPIEQQNSVVLVCVCVWVCARARVCVCVSFVFCYRHR